MNDANNIFIHSTADVSPNASIGNGTKIWNNAQVREDATLGSNCIVSKNVYIDSHVQIGNNVKVQNNVNIYHGVTVEDDVFLGPSMTFTNDFYPRAFLEDWKITQTLVKKGASIGANSTIVCGIVIGEYTMVGSGSVVTKDIPPHTLVVGNPAKPIHHVCKCGTPFKPNVYTCEKCGFTLENPVPLDSPRSRSLLQEADL